MGIASDKKDKDKPQENLAILATSRDNGDTSHALNELTSNHVVDVISFSKLNISPFDYHNCNIDDDFLCPLIRMTEATTIIVATPVYWYSMSAQMKIIFDRLSDLITINKQVGRKLVGKSAAFLAVGSDEFLPIGFANPFEMTFRYFDMSFAGSFYICTGERALSEVERRRQLDSFAARLWGSSV